MTLVCLFPEGGGSFDDSDLADVAGGDYKPDGGKTAAPPVTFLPFNCVDVLQGLNLH